MTNDATRDAWVTIPEIAEQIPWLTEKTCRESIRKILKLIHIDMEDFVDPDYKSKRYSFPSEITDTLIIFLKAYYEPWFQKKMKGEEATLEDNIAWINKVLPEIEKLGEPLRGKVLGMPWLKNMLRSKELSEMTMRKTLEMKELFNDLPEDKRLEILEEIQPALDQFLSRLRSLAGVTK